MRGMGWSMANNWVIEVNFRNILCVGYKMGTDFSDIAGFDGG